MVAIVKVLHYAKLYRLSVKIFYKVGKAASKTTRTIHNDRTGTVSTLEVGISALIVSLARSLHLVIGSPHVDTHFSKLHVVKV